MNEQTEELASLYALDLLEGEELRVFEKQMSEDGRLANVVAELRSSAALLAHDVPPRTPSTGLEHRIFKALHGTGAAPRVSPFASSWIPWAIAASLLAACLVLLADRTRTSQQLAVLQQRHMIAQTEIAMLSSKLENAPRATAVVVWDPEKQEGVLKAIDVPPNASDRDYQLWVVDPQYKQPVSGGVFRVEPTGATKISFKPEAHVNAAKAFAVTLERKGGVSKAEGPMILLSK
ncbi:MAG: anti-sigma factor [Chthoniobacterales bacterium]|nr:anti-sigma factor [Chthoniobacterales bacterium]